ncbi:hypothetical protein GCM10010401_05850 [Rarobacter faecitabidus]|uniref:Mycothiol maleylpyruvate isomerase-like protein n=1 Tax=Rarobacter faecitabidus TaxID=13243 RepID=A0A542ZTH7_RARFA|nr:maleylpyruvate isomerase N-terminal domain-containing protein [Rarobacter faecitabidus]TQL63663.1 mycothiol maleylpyruvate isomerase-like protein [Rarobacter faecitabidus]
MTAVTSYADVAAALASQWRRLDNWLSESDEDLLGIADQASSLPGWTNRDLVIHLARAWSALSVSEPSPIGTIPLTLAEYLGSYPSRADEIDELTRELSALRHDDPLRAVKDEASVALSKLKEFEEVARGYGLADPGDLVIQARRGPILLRDMVISRLVELVVHAIDLSKSFAGILDSRGEANPILPSAAQIVAEELLHIVLTRGGWSLVVSDPLRWIALASGRSPYDVDELARALEPTFTSDAVPDLGRMLPLL